MFHFQWLLTTATVLLDLLQINTVQAKNIQLSMMSTSVSSTKKYEVFTDNALQYLQTAQNRIIRLQLSLDILLLFNPSSLLYIDLFVCTESLNFPEVFLYCVSIVFCVVCFTLVFVLP